MASNMASKLIGSHSPIFNS